MGKRLETEIRREQIAEAALQLAVEKGVGAVTVKNIALSVGVTAPALYRHYANKSEILASVIDHIVELHESDRRQVQEKTTDPVSFLREIYRRNIRFYKRHNGIPVLFLSDLLWQEEPALGERLRRDFKRFERETAEIIRDGQTRKLIRDDVAAEEIVIAFLSMYVTLGTLLSRGFGDFDLERQAEVNWLIFEEFLLLHRSDPERRQGDTVSGT